MTRYLLQIYRILFEEYGPQRWWPGNTKDEIIIGAILTQNTNWTNVEKAITNLKAAGLLSLHKLSKSAPDRVAELIRSAGYFNQKAQRLICISQVMQDFLPPEDIPGARKFLLNLKGIGPETADSILLYAFDLPVFVIDTYTHRLFNRLGVVPDNASYSDLQQLFMQHLKPDPRLYNEYHALIVRHAKLHCRKQPVCLNCPLSTICRFALEQEAGQLCT